MFDFLKEKAEAFNINLSDEQVEKFKEYLRLLTEFNRHTNLVSSTELKIVIEKHFLDSLSLGLASGEIDFTRNLNVIDIGIGGGFPGIPLIIAFPHWKLCAVDSVAKKLNFIKILAEKLKLTDKVEVIAARAEELARQPDKREHFDLAVTRAVAKMNVISEYCLPFVKKGGYFAAYKAKTASEELQEAQRAISELGGEHVLTLNSTVSGNEQRNLILIEKTAPTPDKYPRKTGKPSKKPLI